ncbi:monothiol glutaredoxin-S7, chloroplastic [Selaginella moellendorffii]|uniref:monothiol glutaredoxin-S7, chloroplastic n=1 Tax=Selaginella moellendorffii TaxID=88036 RepID=UPI000D1C682E|nr:monothiol glutaredoxin-S7, chloroplastic [Selaginella moellendorffii]|eukprot:XP_002977407.2 monothiol glutaredoxin-S7, chloroplastic [Selaginella moellendorffii]
MEAMAANFLAASSSSGLGATIASSRATASGSNAVISISPRKSLRVPCIASPRRQFAAGRTGRALICRASLTPELRESVEKFVKGHKVVLFMKGTKLFPQCGFSNTVVQILNNLGVPYETVNILEDDGLRQGLKAYSNWPTFPQLYIDGEFFGGCDITLEAFQSGQLKEVVEKAMCS